MIVTVHLWSHFIWNYVLSLLGKRKIQNDEKAVFDQISLHERRSSENEVKEEVLNIEHVTSKYQPVRCAPDACLNEVDKSPNDLLITVPPNKSSLCSSVCEADNTNVAVKKYSYINFPFLQDQATIFHVMNSHVMFIMRGLPGSGKTTIVNLIKNTYQNAVTCSADDYFLINGEYHFDVRGLENAHRSCQNKALDACEKSIRTIVIDNTNVRKWEMNHYFQLASRHGYTVIIVIPQTPWRFNAEELARRNKHGVQIDILSAKVEKFDKINPMYWAWFINKDDGGKLISLIDKFFDACCNLFPAMVENLKNYHANPDLFLNYVNLYNLKSSFHCTAYFGGRGRSVQPGTSSYAARTSVVNSMGQSQNLSITGITITAKTIGARVQLTEDQLALWGKDDSESWSHKQAAASGSLKPGSRAHVTIAFARGVEAVQTGFDQIQLAELELRCVQPDSIRIEEDVELSYYREGICAIKFANPIVFNTLFSGYY